MLHQSQRSPLLYDKRSLSLQILAQKIKVTNTSKFWILPLLPFGDDTLAQWEHSEYGSRSSWQNSHAITSEFNWPFERLMSTEPVPFVVRGPYPPRPAQRISVPDERSLLTCQPRKDGWSARKWAKKKRISITILLNFPTQLGKGAALPQLLPGAWTGKQIHQIDFNRKTRLSFLPLGPILPHPPRQHRKPTLCVCVCARAPNRVNSRNFDWLFYLFLLLILPPNFRVGGCKPFFGPSEIIDTTAQSINEILFCGFYVFGFLHLIYLFGKDVNHSHQSKSAITAHRAI